MKRGTRPYPNLIERHILASLNKPFECWPYPGYTRPNGYATVYMKNRPKPVTAHVAAYLMCVGPVPEGLELDHLCRNPSCCNPNHLEPVTHRENMLRSPTAASAVRARQTECTHGHPLAGDNVFLNAKGHRVCRICQKRRNRTAYLQYRTCKDRDAFCVNGHPRTAENTHINERGRRRCRVCWRLNIQRYRKRQRHAAMNLTKTRSNAAS